MIVYLRLSDVILRAAGWITSLKDVPNFRHLSEVMPLTYGEFRYKII